MFGRVSLSKSVIVLITLPLLVEMCFFAALLQQFAQLQKDSDAEANAAYGLVQINLAMTEVTSASGSAAMFWGSQEPAFLMEAQASVQNLEEHSRELEKIAEVNPSPELQAFIDVFNDLESTFMGAFESFRTNTYGARSPMIIKRLHDFFVRLRQTGTKVVEEQSKARMVAREKAAADRKRIELLLAAATAINFGIVVALALAYSLTLGRRFNRVMGSAAQLAANSPLSPALKGSDELAQLDSIIHRVANELAETRLKERALIDNTAEVILSLDNAYRITEVNNAVYKRLGYTSEEWLGGKFMSYVHPDDQAAAINWLTEVLSSYEERTSEIRMISREGAEVCMEVKAQWSEDNHTYFAILRDITARKEVERLKQEVLAMVSHDLRAPLTSVKMTLEMILGGLTGELNARGERLVTVALQSVASLHNMTCDLLDMERFETTGMQIYQEPAALDELIERAASFVTPDADSKKITIRRIGEHVEAEVDADRINRVLVNLLNNAIKFSPPNTEITVTWSHSKETKEVLVKIRDRGPGIEKDKLQLVFEKFRQAGTASEGERQGSGLGLAICKAIVEAHQGKIGVDSEPGNGSTFWFSLPSSAVSPKSDSEFHENTSGSGSAETEASSSPQVITAGTPEAAANDEAALPSAEAEKRPAAETFPSER